MTNWKDAVITKGDPPPEPAERVIESKLLAMEPGDSFTVESDDPVQDCRLVTKAAMRLSLNVTAMANKRALMAERGTVTVWRGQETGQCGTLSTFLAEACETHEDLRFPMQPIYDAYVRWCETASIPAQMTQNKFGRELTRRGYPLDKRNTHRLGIGLKPPQNNLNSNEIIA
jgi:hypothetical protein